MYRIIGSDQKEYGPVTAEQVRQWLAQGRANRTTQIKPEGAADWVTIGDLPEFAASPSTPPPATPPPPSPAASSAPTKTSGMAITSLVLGVLGCFGITGLLGLVFGIISLISIGKSQGRLRGKGLAIAGICVSGFMLLMSLAVLPAMLLPALARAKQRAQAITCVNNVRMLGMGVMMSANANGDRLPDATNWCDKIQSSVSYQKAFLCPAGNQADRCHYAFNAALSGMKLSEIQNPSTLVMIFEAEGGWNQSGGFELVDASRHAGSLVVCFADGHVERIPISRQDQLRWDP